MSRSFDFCPTFADDSSPRLSAQAQAAEDILDKYRNAIKRSNLNEGVSVGYDSAGDGLSPCGFSWGDGRENLPPAYSTGPLTVQSCVFRWCWRRREFPRLSAGRHLAEHVRGRPPRFCQSSRPASGFCFLLQVTYLVRVPRGQSRFNMFWGSGGL